jgi:ribosomal subunit interface protein
MLTLNITGLKMQVDENMHKYITRRLGHLDRLLPRNEREAAHGEVRLRETSGEGKNDAYCEMTLHIPGTNLVAKETTLNIYAAIDIVYNELKTQINKYTEREADGRTGRLFRRHKPQA